MDKDTEIYPQGNITAADVISDVEQLINFMSYYIHPSAKIGPGCLIGGMPDSKGVNLLSGVNVSIGEGVILTKNVVVDAGTVRPTTVGARCFLSSFSYVAHDAILMHDVVLSPGAHVLGHCTIWPYAVLGDNAVIHQQHELAPGAMLAMGCVLPKSVQTEPFTIYVGNGQRLRENTKLLKELPQGEVERLYDLWANRNK